MKRSKLMREEFLITNDNTPFSVVESYKILRTNLLFALSTSEKKFIVMTSAQPMEGKSTVAINLSLALAEAAYKVLLIDGDLRKPVLHKRLKIKNSVGLSNILAGFADEKEAVTTYTANLDVLTSGEIPPNPSELLSSSAMEKLLRRMEQSYDFVIIDSPPAMVVADATAVALDCRYCFGFAGKVGIASACGKVLSQMEFAGIKILGMVLNGAGTGKKKYGGYKKYRYSYYTYKQD